ncbi:MAG: hypothetical protein JW759_05375 [Candidatus Coatesbacteria bacterium]|nr:hypothetical protein [Candidatus Coatesbacteria bacterium]
MAVLKKIPHELAYDGNETFEVAKRAAGALQETGAISLETQELIDLFAGEAGELPIELNVIEARLLQDKFEKVGFGGRIRRVVADYDPRTKGGPFVSRKKDYTKSATNEGFTGMLAFSGVWVFLLLFSILPPLRVLFYPGSIAIPLAPLSLLLGLALAVAEGYFIGIIMGIFGMGWLIGVVVGIGLAGVRSICLVQPLTGALLQCVIGSMIIGADITIKKDDIDCIPREWRNAMKSRMPEVITIGVGSHLLVRGITWVWSKLIG